MGRGDKKTRRGKIVNRSYGVLRPRKSKASSPIIEEKEVKKATKAKAKPKATAKAVANDAKKPKKAASTTAKAKKTKKEETPEE